MRIRLNLATTPVKNDNRFVFGATIIGIIAVIALFGLAWRAYGVRKADEARRTEIAQLQNEITQLNIRRAGVEGFFNDPRILMCATGRLSSTSLSRCAVSPGPAYSWI